MKKQFLAAVAIMVAGVFVGIDIAQAVEVDIGGELRPRWEVRDRDFSDGQTDTDSWVSMRVRLSAKAKLTEDTSAFIQLQSVRCWGEDKEDNSHGDDSRDFGLGPDGCANGDHDTKGHSVFSVHGTGGSDNAALTPNDLDHSVGVHQAFFTIKNFFTLPVDLQIGRQEVILDGHRLWGNTGWTQGAQTHDAIKVTHSGANHTIAYVGSMVLESHKSFESDDTDIFEHIVYANFQGLLPDKSSTSLYFSAVDDDSFDRGAEAAATTFTSGNDVNNNLYTIGARQAGTIFGIDYRAEGYYQFGDAEGISGCGGNVGASTDSDVNKFCNAGPNLGTGEDTDTDRSAYMFGVRVGKKFNSVPMKPKVTIWYDHLSGTDDDDIEDNTWGTFDTLQDTGHKFYGFMDYFLASTGAGTKFLGLQDLALKLAIEPLPKTVLKADIHAFWTTVDADDNPLAAAAFGASSEKSCPSDTLCVEHTDGSGPSSGTGTSGVDTGRSWGSHLGEEMDLTLVHKYNPFVTISGGYSYFWADDRFHDVNGAPLRGDVLKVNGNTAVKHSDNASWGYVMFDVKW